MHIAHHANGIPWMHSSSSITRAFPVQAHELCRPAADLNRFGRADAQLSHSNRRNLGFGRAGPASKAYSDPNGAPTASSRLAAHRRSSGALGTDRISRWLSKTN